MRKIYLVGIFALMVALIVGLPTNITIEEPEDSDYETPDGLEYLFDYGEKRYYISAADLKENAIKASEVCEGHGYELLTINDAAENNMLKFQLAEFEHGDIWTDGKITQTKAGEGDISYHIAWAHSQAQVNFQDFAKKKKLTKRERRSVEELLMADSPVVACQSTQNQQECLDGLCAPDCGKHPSCTITLPPCETMKSPCQPTLLDCQVTRGDCSVSCPPCEITPPQCEVIQGQCEIKQKICQTNQPICNPIKIGNCTTERPPCVTIEKPCKGTKVEIPCPSSPKCTFLDPCSSTQRPCTEKPGICVTTHSPCVYNPHYGAQECGQKITTCHPPKTTCPPPQTSCKPPIHCEPIICYSPALVCEEPETHCPPPITKCQPTEWICEPPKIICEKPEVHCPDPKVICTQPLLVCPGPNITCPGYISHCPTPPQCPLPPVYCPPPIIHCRPPGVCTTISPRPLTNPTCPTGFTECTNCSTTPMPQQPYYGGATWGNQPQQYQQYPPQPMAQRSAILYDPEDGHNYGNDPYGRRRGHRSFGVQTKCIGLNENRGYQWDHKNCSIPRRFICEASP